LSQRVNILPIKGNGAGEGYVKEGFFRRELVFVCSWNDSIERRKLMGRGIIAGVTVLSRIEDGF